MDRSKLPPSKKSSKPKVHAPPGDFIALGKGKSSESDIGVARRPSSPQPVSRKLAAGNERKREAAATTGSTLLTKKPKLMSQTFTPLGRHASEPEKKSSPSTVTPLAFEESAIEVEPCEMLDIILAAEESGDDEKIEGVLCGAVKALHNSRVKPDHVVFLTVMYLAKTHPTLFCSELVIEAFCSLLKRDPTLNFKAKGNALVSVLACNTLMACFAEEDNWPDDFIKVYVEDSLGERVWLDREDCRGFVENIQTAFHTRIPPKSMLLSSTDPVKSETPGSASPVLNLFEEEDVSKSPDHGDTESEKNVSESGVVLPRYPFQQDSIERYVHDIIHDYLNRRQPMDASARNLIRLMSVTAGYAEVRSLAAQRLEMWLQNPKLARTAQDLLMSVCMNCNQKEHSDIEVIAQLIKIRMKTKPLVNHYLNCMRELLAQHADNLRIILTHTIYNELSPARNPNNMSLLATTFQVSGEAAAKMLAEVFQDLSANKDDYLRALRALLREIVRAVRHDMNFPAFCLGLMQERSETKFAEMDGAFKERFVMSMLDLITLSVLLGITPAVREAVAALSKGESKDIEILHQFKSHCAIIQRDAVWWLHTVVPKIMEIKPVEYVHCLHKVLFLEEAQHYYSKDNWPPEGDRIMMLKQCAEVPIMEDTLMRVLLIGLSRELPLSAVDAVELGDQLIRRAAALYYGVGMEVLHVEKLQLIDALLNLCAYRHPEKIALPKGYQPPTLAISTLYWKAWIMLLILSAFNPSTFGVAAWEKYPTLKLMMEMAMTNNFTFPPPTLASDEKTVEELKNRERQIHQREVQGILEFESHLAAATSKVTITESNSLLIDQVTSMDPSGVARCPPPKILEQLQSLNNTLKIGQMLCRSRNPDFLLDIIQRQGTSQSMPWLAEMVESSEGSLDVLPVQCLCEFLLHEPPELTEMADAEAFKTEKYRRRQKVKKQRVLLGRLQTVVHGARSDSTTTFEVLDYFFKRLASTQAGSRAQAIKGLSMVLSKSQTTRDSESDEKMEVDPDSGDTTHAWLLEHLPALPLFDEVKGQACLALRQACQIETEPSLVSAYVVFLSQHAMDQNLHKLDDLALDIAQLIVERTSVVNHILPADSESSADCEVKNKTLTALIDLHMNYLVKAKEPDKEAYSWSNTQDQIILQWDTGESATMHILVVHAMIILLTYGPPTGESLYQDLLETWFPENGHLPSAFLLDTSEEALLLPDWLKLRMIRSSVDRLVNAALQELEPSQLLVFVQSFGIPVSSMSKLLLCLDNAVAIDSTQLEHDVVDKTYMAQLIEIQHKRGAQGGQNFNKMLSSAAALVTQEQPDSESEMECGGQSCWQVKKEEHSSLFASPHQLVQSLLEIFMTPGVSSPSQNKTFQSLLKAVSGDVGAAQGVLMALQQIINSPQSAEFCGKMFDMPSKSCPLLKLFIAKQLSLHQHLKPVMDKLESVSKGCRSALSSVVCQFIESYGQQREKQSSKESEIIIPKELLETKGKLDSAKFIQAMQTVAESNLECLVQQCIEKSVEMEDTAASVGIACKVLLDSEQSLPESAACLFVDWLELLDPEIIQSNDELQQQLLFAKKASCPSGSSGLMNRTRNQPYLLALLTHQSNWTTLHRCIDRLLHPRHANRYDPTSVLDFLWACLHIPKIWQGRERKLQTSATEDMLGLTATHITAVVKFITEETLAVTSAEQPSGQNAVSTVTQVIQSRLDLLLLCVADVDDKLKTVVTFLQQENLHKSAMEVVYNSLFLELYLHRPYILSWLPNNSRFLTELHSAHLSQSQMDTITHRVLTALGDAKSGKVAEKRMRDANITCRKLAAEHPSLLLRQLPMIAAILQGKTQFTFGEMVHRNFLSLFNYCLGLLELLQPHVFRREHSALADVLQSYFCLIRGHGRDNRQLNALIVRFVVFLNNFLSCDPHRAITMLQKYTEVLSNVSLLFPDLSELKSLLAGLTLPVQSQTEAAVFDDDGSSLGLAMKPASMWTAAQLEQYHKKLKKNTPTEITEVLDYLDKTSKRKVEILEHFEDDLKRFMTNGSDILRNTTFSLVMRHLKHNPRRAGDFVPVFLQCLSQTSPDIISTALTNLAEFTVLCQAHAQVILQKVFTLGITSSIETSSYISETLHLLNLESALT